MTICSKLLKQKLFYYLIISMIFKCELLYFHMFEKGTKLNKPAIVLLKSPNDEEVSDE